MFMILSAFLMIILILIKTGWSYGLAFLFLIEYIFFKKYPIKNLILIHLLMGCFFIWGIKTSFSPLPSQIEGTVIDVRDYDYVLKTKHGKVKVLSDDLDLQKGNHLSISIEEVPFNGPQNLNAYDDKQYCFSQKIYYQVRELSRDQNDHHLSLMAHLENYVEGFKKETSSYTKQLLLGLKDNEMKETLSIGQRLSILHLFALSGMHLTMLKKSLSSCGLKKESFQLCVLGIYVYLLGYIISLWRAYLMLLIRYLCKRKYNDLEILAIVSMLLCLHNPYVIYSLSYIYSFSVYGVLVLSKNTKFSMLYPYLTGIPILLSTSYSFNPLSLAFVWLFSSLIEWVYRLVLFNFITFNLFESVVQFCLAQFERVLFFLDGYVFEWIFKKPSLLFILLFYLCLFYALFKDQLKLKPYSSFMMMGLLLFILYFSNWLMPIDRVSMINVGQGDCFLVQLAYNKGNYLIDTGGHKEVNLAKSRIVPYLKSLGIKQLDALIITHDDFDHCGEKEELLELFKVKEVVMNKKDVGPLKNLDITVLSNEENDQSLVYYLYLNKTGYLFTGDMSIEGEKQIVEKYPNLKIDVLKVGHHGSNTSTSALLLDHYQPRMALISVGKNNMYRHPNAEVIERLNAYGVKIYRSDLDGMVELQHYFGRTMRIISCRKEGKQV